MPAPNFCYSQSWKAASSLPEAGVTNTAQPLDSIESPTDCEQKSLPGSPVVDMGSVVTTFHDVPGSNS